MDQPTQAIVNFVASSELSNVDEGALRAAALHHLDGVGCAAGGFSSQPALIARELARATSGRLVASVYGLPDKALIDYATFANAVMNRYLDFNDMGGPGHPNDMAPALLAGGEAYGRSGGDVLLANYIAYEVAAALRRTASLRPRGWDQGAYCALGAVAGLAKLVGLTDTQLANALSLVITPNIPMRVVRTGELSHWKGCATAHATKLATTAVQLAQAGLTGPPEPFAGVDGFFAQVSGEFELHIDPPARGTSAIEQTSYKYYPSEFNSQVPLGIVLRLRGDFGSASVESLRVDTHHLAWHEIGGGQGDHEQKWDPKTRETADHSLPYVLSVALTDGAITPDSFTPERIADPALRPLMNRIEVHEDPEMTAANEIGLWPARVTIKLDDGRELTAFEEVPKGHPTRPLDDDEIYAKFDAMIGRVLESDDAKDLKDRLINLAEVSDLDEVTTYLRRFRLDAPASR